MSLTLLLIFKKSTLKIWGTIKTQDKKPQTCLYLYDQKENNELSKNSSKPNAKIFEDFAS